jgi:predicted nucleic acid-binding Zn ribbon protein
MQRFSDEPKKRCPECSGRVDKLISQSTFHLKGTGWYATDYGKKSHGGGAGKKKSEGSENKRDEDKVDKKEKKADD